MIDITALVESTLKQLSETLQSQQKQALVSMQRQLSSTLQTLKLEQQTVLASLTEKANSDNRQLENLLAKLEQLERQLNRLS